MDKTQQVILEMLLENTGKHFLDSGGAYGRHWERNNEAYKTDSACFLKQPTYELVLDRWKDKEGKQFQHLSVVANLFPWLSERLEFCPELQTKLEAFCRLNKTRNIDPIEFINVIERKYKVDASIDNNYVPFWECSNGQGIYTYNEETILSQDIIYCPFNADLDGCGAKQYILLSIHNGCDARGGFTNYKVFQVNDVWEFTRYSAADVADQSGTRWVSECGYSFVCEEGQSDDKSVLNLEDYTLETDKDGNILSPVDCSILNVMGY